MEAVFSKGKVTRQAHFDVPEGTFEEEHGREAFAGRASHLYRMHPPTAWVRIDGELRPRAMISRYLLDKRETDAEHVGNSALGTQSPLPSAENFLTEIE